MAVADIRVSSSRYGEFLHSSPLLHFFPLRYSRKNGRLADNQGYDISNYEIPDPRYGTLSDWEELRDEVHKHGMRLVMDLVINHSSEEVSSAWSRYLHDEMAAYLREDLMRVSCGFGLRSERSGDESVVISS